MLLEDQILLIPKLLNDTECQQLIDYFSLEKEYTENSYNVTTENAENSNFTVNEIELDSDEYKLAFAKIELALTKWVQHLEMFNAFNTKMLKNNLNYPHKIRLMKYEKDAFIHPHTDFSDFSYASCTLNLNDTYTGGEFSFFNKKYTLNLQKGDALVFPNSYFWVHEVLKILSGTRYSINSFILSVPDSKRRTLCNQSTFFQMGKRFNLQQHCDQ